MNDTLLMFGNRIDLEVRFVFWRFALLALAFLAFASLAPRLTSLAAALLLIAVAGTIASSAAHYLLFKPIRRVMLMARAVGTGDFSRRLAFDRDDEIGRLARDLDSMCDQLQAAQLADEAHIAALEQLRHADRIATLGRLASSVAHELGNPLNVIELRAQLIATGGAATAQQTQQSALVIVEQTQRMTRIIDGILSFARMQPARVTPLDLVSILRKAIALCEHTGKKHKARIVLHAPPTAIAIDGDGDKLLQIFINLMVNGMQAMPAGGVLTVRTCDEQRAPEDDPDGAPRAYARVDVTDHGVGIPAVLVASVFDPFFSTKGEEGGTGLGLSVAQGIAREHEGWIDVESEHGRGSTFKVYLPKDSPHENDQ